MVLQIYFKNLELLALSVRYRVLRSILMPHKSHLFSMKCLALNLELLIQINIKPWCFVVILASGKSCVAYGSTNFNIKYSAKSLMYF